MVNPFLERIHEELDGICPGLADNIEGVGGIDRTIATQAIEVLVGFACSSQNTGFIVAARRELSRVQADALSSMLPAVVERALNLNDEWEFRRLLELLLALNSPLLSTYVKLGQNSNQFSIREAANDFVPHVFDKNCESN